jgi:hypothetical protein
MYVAGVEAAGGVGTERRVVFRFAALLLFTEQKQTDVSFQLRVDSMKCIDSTKIENRKKLCKRSGARRQPH